METIVLSWRWQNILSIAIMVIALAFVVIAGGQIFRRASGQSNATS